MIDRQIEYEFNRYLQKTVNKSQNNKKQMLYHYTSVKGFLLMMEKISENKCYIFPGNCRYQNDENELSEGKKLIEEYIEVNINNIDQSTISLIKDSLNCFSNDVYVTCFSSADDMLEQWKYYGKDCGLAIGFDFNECEGFLNEDKAKMTPRAIENYYLDSTVDDLAFLKTDEFEFSTPTISKGDTDSFTRGGLTLLPLDVIYEDIEKEKALQDLISNANDLMHKSNFLNAEDFKKSIITK